MVKNNRQLFGRSFNPVIYSITLTAKSDLPTRSTIAYKTAAFSGCNLTHPEDAGVPSLPI